MMSLLSWMGSLMSLSNIYEIFYIYIFIYIYTFFFMLREELLVGWLAGWVVRCPMTRSSVDHNDFTILLGAEEEDFFFI